MDGHIRLNLGNIGVITLVSVLGLGTVLILIDYFKKQNVPVVSHLAVGGDKFLSGKVAA